LKEPANRSHPIPGLQPMEKKDLVRIHIYKYKIYTHMNIHTHLRHTSATRAASCGEIDFVRIYIYEYMIYTYINHYTHTHAHDIHQLPGLRPIEKKDSVRI